MTYIDIDLPLYFSGPDNSV